MRVRELMTGAPITVHPDTSMLDARCLMLSQHFRHLLVTKDDQLVGIVTDRDIRLNLPSQATSLSVWEINHLLTKLTVGEVMTRAVITVGPDREARDAAMLMLDHAIGALPVTDGGRLAGILTETDILRGFVWLTGGPAARVAGRGRAQPSRDRARSPRQDGRGARSPVAGTISRRAQPSCRGRRCRRRAAPWPSGTRPPRPWSRARSRRRP